MEGSGGDLERERWRRVRRDRDLPRKEECRPPERERAVPRERERTVPRERERPTPDGAPITAEVARERLRLRR